MEKEERKIRTSRLRRIELIVWIIILVLFLSLGGFLWAKHEESFETHSIYMPDVDGLIVGSPIHIMGIPVGYVTKTKIINDNEIKVKFKITNKSVHIPAGTFATVEFTGLGGSKSLELYPPGLNKEPNELVGKNHFIMVDRPKRLRDSMALLYEMYNTFMNMIYTVTDFGKQLNSIEKHDLPTGNANDFRKLLDVSDKYIDNYDQDMKSIRKILKLKGAESEQR